MAFMHTAAYFLNNELNLILALDAFKIVEGFNMFIASFNGYRCCI